MDEGTDEEEDEGVDEGVASVQTGGDMANESVRVSKCV